MRRRLLYLFLFVSLLLPLTAAAFDWPWDTTGTVPKAANLMATEMDTQVQTRSQVATRAGITIACTVPVSLNELNKTSPLARQMMEEMSRSFVEAGYYVDEIRMGKEIVMTPDKGEFLLTRDLKQLAEKQVGTMLALVGTYTITKDSVRFNMRLLHVTTGQVVAQANATVPVTEELIPLLSDSTPPPPLAPSVRTKLQ